MIPFHEEIFSCTSYSQKSDDVTWKAPQHAWGAQQTGLLVARQDSYLPNMKIANNTSCGQSIELCTIKVPVLSLTHKAPPPVGDQPLGWSYQASPKGGLPWDSNWLTHFIANRHSQLQITLHTCVYFCFARIMLQKAGVHLQMSSVGWNKCYFPTFALKPDYLRYLLSAAY